MNERLEKLRAALEEIFPHGSLGSSGVYVHDGLGPEDEKWIEWDVADQLREHIFEEAKVTIDNHKPV